MPVEAKHKPQWPPRHCPQGCNKDLQETEITPQVTPSLHHRHSRQRPHVEAGEPQGPHGDAGEPARALSMLNVNVEVWPVAKAPQDSHPSWRGPPPPQFGLVPGAGGLPLPRWCHCYFKACGPAQHIPSPVVSPMPQDTAHGLGF